MRVVVDTNILLSKPVEFLQCHVVNTVLSHLRLLYPAPLIIPSVHQAQHR